MAKRRPWLPVVVLSAALGACVEDREPTHDGQSEDELECREACIAKGVSEADCVEACAEIASKDPGSGKPEKPDDERANGDPAAGTDPADDNHTAPDDGHDPAAEKSCVQCWYDAEAGACADEAKACEDSLACTQLQWCPFLCEDTDCVEQCAEIIPSGVEPLTALVRCAICDDGPCAEACADSAMLAYCE